MVRLARTGERQMQFQLESQELIVKMTRLHFVDITDGMIGI